MTRMIKNVKNALNTNAMKWALAVAAVTCFAPALASAQVHDYRRHDRGDRYDHRYDHRHDHGGKSDVRIGIGFGSPGYASRVERVWVEPVYRTDCERIWIEPIYRTERDRIWIEPVYEIRETVRYEWGRRVVHRERVIVRAGCWEERPRQVMVSPGRWETVERRVLVSAGYWDERVIAYPARGPDFMFGFGYRK